MNHTIGGPIPSKSAFQSHVIYQTRRIFIHTHQTSFAELAIPVFIGVCRLQTASLVLKSDGSWNRRTYPLERCLPDPPHPSSSTAICSYTSDELCWVSNPGFVDVCCVQPRLWWWMYVKIPTAVAVGRALVTTILLSVVGNIHGSLPVQKKHWVLCPCIMHATSWSTNDRHRHSPLAIVSFLNSEYTSYDAIESPCPQ